MEAIRGKSLATADDAVLAEYGSTRGSPALRQLLARSFAAEGLNVDGMALYVNNGTGLWPGFALRLGRPSELTRITLRRPSPA